MRKLDTRLRRAEKEVNATRKIAEHKKRLVLVTMFEDAPPFKPFDAKRRKWTLAEAQARAGETGRVCVVEWGERWEAIRPQLTELANQNEKI
jgi:hypothetical protein